MPGPFPAYEHPLHWKHFFFFFCKVVNVNIKDEEENKLTAKYAQNENKQHQKVKKMKQQDSLLAGEARIKTWETFQLGTLLVTHVEI